MALCMMTIFMPYTVSAEKYNAFLTYELNGNNTVTIADFSTDAVRITILYEKKLRKIILNPA